MAKILGIYTTKDDISFFEVTMLIDIIVIFVMAIIAIAHTSIIGEGAATITAILDILYSGFGVYVFLDFKKHKEVQLYHNYIYATSRQMWNTVSLIIVFYLAIMSGFWAFGKANRSELIPVLVFHILSLLYILAALVIFKQLKEITNGQFSASDESNYVESYNYAEKVKHGEKEALKFHNLWGSDNSYQEQKSKNKKQKNKYYEVENEIEYMDDKKHKDVDYMLANETVNMSDNYDDVSNR